MRNNALCDQLWPYGWKCACTLASILPLHRQPCLQSSRRTSSPFRTCFLCFWGFCFYCDMPSPCLPHVCFNSKLFGGGKIHFYWRGELASRGKTRHVTVKGRTELDTGFSQLVRAIATIDGTRTVSQSLFAELSGFVIVRSCTSAAYWTARTSPMRGLDLRHANSVGNFSWVHVCFNLLVTYFQF